MSTLPIECNNISVSFDTIRVLDHVNLEVQLGTCFALLGPNGAGKSTLLHVLTDLVKPDAGTVCFGNLEMPGDTRAIKSQIGVVLETTMLPSDLSVGEHLRFACLLYGLPPAEHTPRVEQLVSFFFDHLDVLNKRCGALSTGMRKKVALITACLHAPDVLLLDEPFSGLDPAAAHDLTDFLHHYLSPDRAILLSSHRIDRVQHLATHIGVLNRGQLLFSGTAEAFSSGSAAELEDSLLRLIDAPSRSASDLDWLTSDD